ncbi:glycoside hydrolase [Stereum hirsutum FP-91666 SS1]|uniref:glycoside hydrolase n=1 Tax=Stereum hirsutum (strain FP-91666) TaxID=721885 RepID=UPI000444A476|nr:glycoside hydrolase [Stereum hirsutum FP-91666 SS1]EIM86043.1 glycoside hydrolase [Stereum hirsutum FP-91666 SS1]
MTSSSSTVTSASTLPSSSSTTISSTDISSSTTTSSAPTSSSTASSSGSDKYVVAHHMVGNTYPYTVDTWAADIALAYANGIDGFALNIGSDDWQPARVADAYTAASQSGTLFKLFLSFDMSALPCTTADHAATLRTYITTYASHPNQLIYRNRVFASTFSGESCTFGQGSVVDGWSSQFTSHPDLTGQNAVFFVPSFFVDPATFGTYDNVMDGALNWNSAWPISVTTSTASSVLSSIGASLSALSSLVTGDGTARVSSAIQDALASLLNETSTSDSQYISGLNSMSAPSDGGDRIYVATASPWFYTHYSPETFNKNFVYYTDSHLYPTRWESLVASRDQVDIVEIVTWNDYGESHYIGPIEGDQPNSQAWVDGFDHTGWLDMTRYYAEAFKTGTYPTITEDKIYMWSRPHPKDASASNDSVDKPANFDMSADTLWAVIMATSASTVTLSTSSTNSQTFSVPSGVSKLSIPISAGDTMHGTIERDGVSVVDLQPEGFMFQGSPETYNYNAFVAFKGAGTGGS